MSAHADLICFSNHSWELSQRRPQELLSRAARNRRVYFVEAPELAGAAARLATHVTAEGVTVVRPTLPSAINPDAIPLFLRDLVDQLVGESAIDSYVLWFDTPLAMAFARDLRPLAVVYDRMEEAAPTPEVAARLAAYETQLRLAADLVFTGEPDPFAPANDRVYAFPGGVDAAHFALARTALPAPPDQAKIPETRVGFYGVIDERVDLDLVDGVARLRPDLQLVMLGPSTLGSSARLPKRKNLHWLGPRPYRDLPAYLAGWDVAILPLARHGAGRPHGVSRVPEYLASGRPVVATRIAHVVEPYRALDLVRIADNPADVAAAIDAARHEDAAARLSRADRWLATIAWDQTWQGMDALITAAVAARSSEKQKAPSSMRR
jgi:UDP-galactopyranose mutase